MNAERGNGEGPETASGKTAADENFPVASLLLARHDRPVVLAYYAFARTADDIADSPALSPEEKTRRLDLLDGALAGRGEGPCLEDTLELGRMLKARGISPARASGLLEAFRQDACKTRYATWLELRDYCRRSAEPVGRFLLDLHGESRALYPASDALCAALQVLNHIQDIAEDKKRLDRVYLPQDWMAREGVTQAALVAQRSSPELRRVIGLCLGETESLLQEAGRLAGDLRSWRLRIQAATTFLLARRLQTRLERSDPLAGRVALSRWDFLAATLSGLCRALLRSPAIGQGGLAR